MRKSSIVWISAAAGMAAALVLAADRSGASSAKKAAPAPASTPAPSGGCKSCVEKGATLDPNLFWDRRIYDPDVQPSYRVARQIPSTLDRLHCFCECAESPQFHHKTLLTCYTDNHAAGCGICMKEALLAAELKQKGASDEEIIQMVDSMFRTEGHPPTH